MVARHYVVELRLGEETTELIECVWRRLADADITSTMPRAGGRPHVSLVVGSDATVSAVQEALAAVCRSQDPLRVTFPYLGLFRGDVTVGFLGVTQTLELALFQRDVFRAVEPHFRVVDENYRPERAVLHCTLGLDIPPGRLADYDEIVRSSELPREGLVRELDVVEYFPARTMASLALRPAAVDRS